MVSFEGESGAVWVVVHLSYVLTCPFADKYSVASRQCNKTITSNMTAGSASEKSGTEMATRRRKRPQRFVSSSQDEDNPAPKRLKPASSEEQQCTSSDLQAKVLAVLKGQKKRCTSPKQLVTKKLFKVSPSSAGQFLFSCQFFVSIPVFSSKCLWPPCTCSFNF